MANLELYRVFYTVAKCGSLTKAAEELYISQPAASQSIKQLENQLGISLFNRTHRGMELSAQGGKLIFSRVEQALSLLEEAENSIAQLNTSATGTIRVGASDMIFEYFLADKIVEYHEKFPAVKIELMSDLSPRTLEALKANRCDVCFVNLPIALDPELSLHGNCMRLTDVFVTNEKHIELTRGVIPLAKLQEYPLILLEQGTVARRSLNSFLENVGIELKPAIEIGSWDLMKRLVIRGMGIGCIPREYALHRLADKSLYEIRTDPPLPARSVGMVLPKNAQIPYALRALIKMFISER